ncbi:hypothetical protein BH09CHL1_BH09CHL1_21540 [soil metagenome]
MSRALWSHRGIVGFVPNEAIDAETGTLVIEIDIVLKDQRRVSVAVPTRYTHLQSRLQDPNDGSVASIRQWIIDRGLTRFDLANSDLAAEVSHVEAIYWICGKDRRRDPFLL